jgi:uncharacterized damage-inducible protein DinB
MRYPPPGILKRSPTREPGAPPPMTSTVQDSTLDLRYPTGRFQRPAQLDADARTRAIEIVTATPGRLRDAIRGLTEAQLDTPYRPEGWTVRQVAHHVPDSHLNAYVRFKLALTENEPTIKPYEENLWAELADVKAVPVETSLTLLEAVHERWVAILRAMTPADFERRLVHPESGVQRLDQVLALYAWHGPHHIAQITSLRERMGWK